MADQRLVARCQGHASFVTAIAFDHFDAANKEDARVSRRAPRFASVGEDCRVIFVSLGHRASCKDASDSHQICLTVGFDGFCAPKTKDRKSVRATPTSSVSHFNRFHQHALSKTDGRFAIAASARCSRYGWPRYSACPPPCSQQNRRIDFATSSQLSISRGSFDRVRMASAWLCKPDAIREPTNIWTDVMRIRAIACIFYCHGKCYHCYHLFANGSNAKGRF